MWRFFTAPSTFSIAPTFPKVPGGAPPSCENEIVNTGLTPRTAAAQTPIQGFGTEAEAVAAETTPFVDCSPDKTPAGAPPPPPARPLPADSPPAEHLRHAADEILRQLEKQAKVANDGQDSEWRAADADSSEQMAVRRAQFLSQRQEAQLVAAAQEGDAGLGEDNEGLQTETESSQEADLGLEWRHREHHTPLGGQPTFESPANQAGSRARKYAFKAVEKGVWVAEEEEQSQEY